MRATIPAYPADLAAAARVVDSATHPDKLAVLRRAAKALAGRGGLWVHGEEVSGDCHACLADPEGDAVVPAAKAEVLPEHPNMPSAGLPRGSHHGDAILLCAECSSRAAVKALLIRQERAIRAASVPSPEPA